MQTLQPKAKPLAQLGSLALYLFGAHLLACDGATVEPSTLVAPQEVQGSPSAGTLYAPSPTGSSSAQAGAISPTPDAAPALAPDTATDASFLPIPTTTDTDSATAGPGSGSGEASGQGVTTAVETATAGTAETVATEATDNGPAAPEPSSPATPNPTAANGGASRVTFSGRVLEVQGEPFHIRGVCYNPVPKGQTQADGVDFAGAAPVDIPLMQAAGINAVRTYQPLTDRSVLDAFHGAGIYVLNTVYAYGGTPVDEVTQTVDAVKDHPAILMWLVGNEWNYNGLYQGLDFDTALARINQVAAAITEHDPQHPIATVYGELPSEQTLERMPDIDVWGLNVYRGLHFGSLFDDFANRSVKPYFIAEYGADAYNANLPGPDVSSQAEATAVLTQEIEDHAAAFFAEGTCAGGTLFEWSDEWWKDGAGSPAEHDVGGIAPGGGPYPDQTFNEEWWGVVDVDRNPRPALQALADVFAAP